MPDGAMLGTENIDRLQKKMSDWRKGTDKRIDTT